MTRTTTTRRTIAEWMDAFPGTNDELANALGTSRQTVWLLRTNAHAKVPLDLLRRLASVLADGTIDGSKAPTEQQLVRVWNAARGAS